MLGVVIYISLLGIPMVLLLIHMLTVLLQPPMAGKQVQRVQRDDATPLGAGRLTPRHPVERPAPAVALSPSQVIQMGVDQRRIEQHA
jgi:hypothetical protein